MPRGTGCRSAAARLSLARAAPAGSRAAGHRPAAGDAGHRPAPPIRATAWRPGRGDRSRRPSAKPRPGSTLPISTRLSAEVVRRMPFDRGAAPAAGGATRRSGWRSAPISIGVEDAADWWARRATSRCARRSRKPRSRRTAAELLPDPVDWGRWIDALKRRPAARARDAVPPAAPGAHRPRAWTGARSPANPPAPRDGPAPPARRDRLSPKPVEERGRAPEALQYPDAHARRRSSRSIRRTCGCMSAGRRSTSASTSATPGR